GLGPCLVIALQLRPGHLSRFAGDDVERGLQANAAGRERAVAEAGMAGEACCRIACARGIAAAQILQQDVRANAELFGSGTQNGLLPETATGKAHGRWRK